MPSKKTKTSAKSSMLKPEKRPLFGSSRVEKPEPKPVSTSPSMPSIEAVSQFPYPSNPEGRRVLKLTGELSGVIRCYEATVQPGGVIMVLMEGKMSSPVYISPSKYTFAEVSNARTLESVDAA